MDPEVFIETLEYEQRKFATFLYHLFKNLERKMAADFTAFNSVVADLSAKVDANTASIAANTASQQALSTEINNVIAILKSGGTDQATVDAAVAALQALSSKAATQAGSLAAEGAETAADLANLQAADGSAPPPPPAGP